MNDIIEMLEQTINDDLKLKRDDRDWLIPDTNTNIRARSPHRHSMGFSLDVPGSKQKPLAFFSARPPEGLAKMCDALIAVAYRNKLYLFAIEAKSANRGNYCKQLTNGRHFWHWLIALYKEHGYLPLKSEPLYIAVLIWKLREKQVRKGAMCVKAPLRIPKITALNLLHKRVLPPDSRYKIVACLDFMT